MKKTTLKAKIIAAVLAAVTAVSVGTMAMATTASAASLQTETIRTIAKLDDKTGGILGRISDKDLEKLKDVGIATVIAGIAEFVPGGKIMMPALQALAGSAFGNPKMTLEDIDKRIDGLYDRIEQFEKDMQNELKNIVSIENFDYSTFTPFNSQIEGIVKAVKTIKNSGNYTTKQKLAMIGAQIGMPDRRVIHITGDGSFHMNLNEACTAVSEGLPIITVIMNNTVLGMVYQWQTAFYGKRYSATTPECKTDFPKMIEAFGGKGFSAATPQEFAEVFRQALKEEGPVWIDCAISPDERVLPMIPGGGTLEDMIIG